MASHVKQIVQGAQKLKVKELAPFISKYSKENLTYSKLEPQVAKGFEEYKANYIDKGSIKPLLHVMWGVFFISFAINLPGEYRHMRAEEEAKLHGKKAH